MRKYFSISEAADYCGYAPETFSRHLKEFPLPKYGPKRNRLKAEDLDLWMESPEEFHVVLRPERKVKPMTQEEMKRAIFSN